MFRPTHVIPTTFTGLALLRLRFTVLICCWVIGLALVTQIGVWIAATFTEVRHQVIKGVPTPALIVSSTIKHTSEASAGIEAGNTAVVNHPENVADPNLVLSKHDAIMNMASRIASAAAMLALLVLLPVMALAVMLATGSAVPGVEHTVSSFTWAVMLGLLLLPIAEFVGMPWREGALYAYSSMTTLVDQAADKHTALGMTYYARFGLLPLACLIGAGMVGLRFCAGIEAGLPRKEDMRLDPTLEREAGNISPTSLHGGRTGAALRAAAAAAANPTPSASASQPHPAGMTQPTAGVVPKRLI
jgi:hypothetical protein